MKIDTLLAIAGLAAQFCFAQSTGAEFFEKKIRPVIQTKCTGCHGNGMQMAGLNLASAQGFLKGSKNGKIVRGTEAADSRLYQVLSYSEKVRMPPTGKLAPDQLADFKTWIGMGAPWPQEARSPEAVAANGQLHWSFRPVREVLPPVVKDEKWARNPIDRFILAKLEAKKIHPAAPAGKLTLLRRVTYDLTGLPPTPEEITAFLADDSAGAYPRLVDRLLASPQYGERWGRHWLDVARYADSTGMDEDHIYPHGWRYRDYVVKSFNDDKPYDQFVREQLAGDLLTPPVPEATGLLALGPKPLAQQDRIKMIYDVVDEQIDTVSKSLMGLTVACARCHDHKFDPILTRDYYALASIFASTMNFRNLGRPGSVSYIYYAPLDPAAYSRYQTHRWEMYAKELELEEAAAEDAAREWGILRPKVAAFLTAAWTVQTKGVTAEAAAREQNVEPRQVERWVAWLKAAGDKAREGYLKPLLEATGTTIGDVAKKYQEDYAKSGKKWDDGLSGWRRRFSVEVTADRDIPARPKLDAEENPFFAAATINGGPMELADSGRVAELRAEFKKLEQTLPPEPAMASAVTEGVSVDQHVFVRGDHLNPGEPVAKQFPIVLAGAQQTPVTKGSGRLELAQWLTKPEHPLTARVMVNRIWQGHFGEALVRTPNNWGATGDPPTHPELLDYLAKRFVESGWSIKSMHRMILLSNTYQMSSQTDQSVRDADPANRLWSRFNRTRMSIEQIRDSLLALSGELDPTIGGSLLKAAKGRPVMNPDESTRRTLYSPVRRGSVPTVLATFDFGDATTAGDGRPRTNVAPQALFLMNSKFVIDRSRAFAKRLLAQHLPNDASLSDTQRVEQAYRMALTRPPAKDEIDSALSYIAAMEQKLAKPDAHETAWQSFCHVLMASNEFIYLN